MAVPLTEEHIRIIDQVVDEITLEIESEVEATHEEPREPGHYLRAAELMMELNRNAEAEELLRRGLDHLPDDPRIHLRLGESLLYMGLYAEAVTPLRRSYELEKTVDALVSLGRAFNAMEDYHAAEEHFVLAILMEPSLSAYISLGRSQMKSGSPEKALQNFLMAESLVSDPRSPEAQEIPLYVADAFFRSGRLEEAEARYRAGAYGPEPRHPEILLRYGALCEAGGRYEEAVHKLAEAITVLPDHAAAHYLYGRAQAGLDRRKEAEAAYARACKLDPENRTYRIDYAWSVADPDKGSRIIKRGLKARPGDVHLSVGLAELLHEWDENEKAISTLSRARPRDTAEIMDLEKTRFQILPFVENYRRAVRSLLTYASCEAEGSPEATPTGFALRQRASADPGFRRFLLAAAKAHDSGTGAPLATLRLVAGLFVFADYDFVTEEVTVLFEMADVPLAHRLWLAGELDGLRNWQGDIRGLLEHIERLVNTPTVEATPLDRLSPEAAAAVEALETPHSVMIDDPDSEGSALIFLLEAEGPISLKPETLGELLGGLILVRLRHTHSRQRTYALASKQKGADMIFVEWPWQACDQETEPEV